MPKKGSKGGASPAGGKGSTTKANRGMNRASTAIQPKKGK